MFDQDYQMYKIVVIGDSGTGKTKISKRYVNGQFTQEQKMTVGVQFLSKIITVQKKKIKITFWDTAGQEKFRSLSKVYYKGAAGILIVYDITDAKTYLNVQLWLKMAHQNLDIGEVKITLLGNKKDLEMRREVELSKAKQDYQQKFGIQCYEVSALTGEGIEQYITKFSQKLYEMNHNVDGSKIPFHEEEHSNQESGVIQQISDEKHQQQLKKINHKQKKNMSGSIEIKPEQFNQPKQKTQKKKCC